MHWAGAVEVFRAFGELGANLCEGWTRCGCGNTRAISFQEGCSNSTAHGGVLSALGTASLATDDLHFWAIQLPPLAACLLIGGPESGGAPFRDGRLCIAATIRRLRSAGASSTGAATFGPGVLSGTGWSAGQSRVFQAWCRNPLGPCGLGSNLTQGVRITLQL